ncbi:MAG TPA: homocysteine S-methyltransferase family protein [Thermoanaerobaculaceae bacterium]|nr:homocysteine S-methyltransferase family protein [Thermoanaerobaculaceae bacterium]
MRPNDLSRWLEGGPRILDGAMGSELLRRGVMSAAKLWGVGALIEAPQAVQELHRGYAAAGAQALTAATFRVAPYALRRIGVPHRAGELAALAVRLARAGAGEAGREALVLASQTTLEDCYRPDLVPDDATLAREHALTAVALAASGADAILLETFNTVREARVAADAAASTGLPVVACFTCTAGGKLLSGEDAAEAARAVRRPGVVAVGVNCTPCAAVADALERIAAGATLPLAAYANNGFAGADAPWLAADPIAPAEYGRQAAAWVKLGARLVGGCCGTGPAHIVAVASQLARAG